MQQVAAVDVGLRCVYPSAPSRSQCYTSDFNNAPASITEAFFLIQRSNHSAAQQNRSSEFPLKAALGASSVVPCGGDRDALR